MKSDHAHRSSLDELYDAVADKARFLKNLNLESLQPSLSLFELQGLKPRPIEVDLWAILAGVPFSQSTQSALFEVQSLIAESLGEAQAYLVEPENCGLELLVLKWHDEPMAEEIVFDAWKSCEAAGASAFSLLGYQLQLHDDGCLVIRGVDGGREFLGLRARILSENKELSRRQSQWVHIPIGRILSPLGEEKLESLRGAIAKINRQVLPFEEIITEVKLINEHRWYMLEKSIVSICQLS